MSFFRHATLKEVMTLLLSSSFFDPKKETERTKNAGEKNNICNGKKLTIFSIKNDVSVKTYIKKVIEKNLLLPSTLVFLIILVQLRQIL